jgi:hypothetical protein
MTGSEYEQFVRAVLAKRLKLVDSQLVSTREPGVTLPGAANLKHQIDLMYFQETEIAEYITIIECKWRESGPVDQQEIQNLAFVKDSTRSHKAIMVTNNGFTAGAKAVAESQRIALLVITPSFEFSESYDTVDELFKLMAHKVETGSNHEMVVCRRFAPDPNERGTDLIEGLLADPAIRKTVEDLLEDPSVRKAAGRILRDNPDLASAARKFLGGGRW